MYVNLFKLKSYNETLTLTAKSDVTCEKFNYVE